MQYVCHAEREIFSNEFIHRFFAVLKQAIPFKRTVFTFHMERERFDQYPIIRKFQFPDGLPAIW